jgi:hypothetical protein
MLPFMDLIRPFLAISWLHYEIRFITQRQNQPFPPLPIDLSIRAFFRSHPSTDNPFLTGVFMTREDAHRMLDAIIDSNSEYADAVLTMIDLFYSRLWQSV